MSKLVPPMSVATTLPSPACRARCSLAETPAIGPEWMVCSASVEFSWAIPPELWMTSMGRA